MTIYLDNRVPYFYIIQHKETGLKYAGAKWAKDADPTTFMTEKGYHTSSNTIHKLITSEGLNTFNIIEIIKLEELQMPFGCQTIDEYESWFLETNDCRNSDLWYNKIINAAYGTSAFRNNMMSKYGVQHSMQNTESRKLYETNFMKNHGVIGPSSMLDWQDKTNRTTKERYGSEWYTQTEQYKIDSSNTCLEKYGATNYFLSDDFKSKKNTYLKSFGEEITNVSQLEFVKEKKKETFTERYGVDHPFKSKEFMEIIVKNNLEKTGFTSPLANPEVREKGNKTNLEKYGVRYAIQNEEIKAKILQTRKDNTYKRFKVYHTGSVHWQCTQCNIAGQGLSNFTRYHNSHIGTAISIIGEKI